ncbi:MAG: hypothetical protein IKE74_06570 [Mogibacterium sp.]|nr:hypothetical protein [Mogibacterium sp.]
MKNGFFELSPEDLEGVNGGAWTGEEEELSMLCAKCRSVKVFRRDEWGAWRCESCGGTETMRYQDL